MEYKLYNRACKTQWGDNGMADDSLIDRLREKLGQYTDSAAARDWLERNQARAFRRSPRHGIHRRHPRPLPGLGQRQPDADRRPHGRL